MKNMKFMNALIQIVKASVYYIRMVKKTGISEVEKGCIIKMEQEKIIEIFIEHLKKYLEGKAISKATEIEIEIAANATKLQLMSTDFIFADLENVCNVGEYIECFKADVDEAITKYINNTYALTVHNEKICGVCNRVSARQEDIYYGHICESCKRNRNVYLLEHILQISKEILFCVDEGVITDSDITQIRHTLKMCTDSLKLKRMRVTGASNLNSIDLPDIAKKQILVDVYEGADVYWSETQVEGFKEIERYEDIIKYVNNFNEILYTENKDNYSDTCYSIN